MSILEPVEGRPPGIARTDLDMTMIAPRWWPGNPGHALVVPLAYHENLYELPAAAGHAVHDLVPAVAVAMRTAYGCGGVTVRQNNEPVGSQAVWHYHVHVFPRRPGDDLHRRDPMPGQADPGGAAAMPIGSARRCGRCPDPRPIEYADSRPGRPPVPRLGP